LPNLSTYLNSLFLDAIFANTVLICRSNVGCEKKIFGENQWLLTLYLQTVPVIEENLTLRAALNLT